MRIKKISHLILGLILLFTLNLSVASAAEFRTADKGGSITIDSEEVVKNLYAAGNMVSVYGEVQKDLYTAGNVVTISSNVEDNIIAAGSTVVIKGDVGGNVHAVGSSIVIEGNISEDLFLAGGNILISETANIGGDLFVGGGTIDLEGYVAGKVTVGGGEVIINGKIDGPVTIEADNVEIGTSAEINQGIKYTSPKEANIDDNATILGEVEFNQQSVNVSKSATKEVLIGIFSLLFLMKLLTIIATLLVLIYLFRNIIKVTTKESLDEFWSSLGIGFAALFLTPILIVILAATMIGLYLAGILLVAYILLIIISSILANIAFGSWLMKVIKKKDKYLISWQEITLGVVVLSLIAFIPVLGGLVCFVFMLISLGALYKLIFKSAIKK